MIRELAAVYRVAVTAWLQLQGAGWYCLWLAIRPRRTR